MRLFVVVLVAAGIIIGCCIAFQYHRERQFKALQFNAELQLFNMQLLEAIGDGVGVRRFMESRRLPFADMRVTVIDSGGNVVYDNLPDSMPLINHLDRPEIAAAVSDGTGYSIRRHSESTGIDYFYSAMHNGDVTVRAAVPYSVPLHDMLRADMTFLWFMAAVAVLTSLGGYFAARRMGHTITRLNKFAAKAERGERIYDDEVFPHDELGDISHHIVRLYARLQHATADLQREHEQTIHQEQEKIRIKKQLTNNINHELKTPVASIQVCLETLMAHPDMDASKREEFIARSYAQSQRLKKMLDDVAVITRMDEGAQRIEMEPVDIRQLVDEVVGELPANDFTIKIDVPEGMVVDGNRSMLASVFRNLLDNAIAYSGGSSVEITACISDEDGYRISVSDNGAGVPPDKLPHLFERFYRVDKGRSRKAGGTGLGLSIVKNAVKLHGGEISVDNKASGGLEVVFSLKRRRI